MRRAAYALLLRARTDHDEFALDSHRGAQRAEPGAARESQALAPASKDSSGVGAQFCPPTWAGSLMRNLYPLFLHSTNSLSWPIEVTFTSTKLCGPSGASFSGCVR